MAAACSVSSLNLFADVPVQVVIDSSEWVQSKPIAAITDGPIRIHREADYDTFVDLSQTMLEVSCKITKANKTNIVLADKVATENLPLHTLFSQVDLELNGKVISSSTSTYAYRAYLETLLTYGQDAKNSWLTASGWYDSPKMPPNPLPVVSDQPAGFQSLVEIFKFGREVTFIGRLHQDMCNQDRFLIPGVNIDLRFIRNNDKFVILRASDLTENYRIEITNLSVWFRQLNVTDETKVAFEQQIQRQPCSYPLVRTEIRTFGMPTGIKSFEEDNVFNGQLPRRVVIGMVTDKCMAGDYSESAFLFEDFDISYMALSVNGKQVPHAPLQMDTTTGIGYTSTRGFISLFAGIGKLFKDEGIDISVADWNSNGKTLFAFDLTPHQTTDCFTQRRRGNLRVSVRFDTALRQPVNLMVYAEFENILQIDGNRNIVMDF
jgi:hypothetical protein